MSRQRQMMSPIHLLAAQLMLPADRGEHNPSGVIHLANASSRFTDATYSEPLTTYILGWTDPTDLQGQLQSIAPDVPVGRRFEFKQTDESADFIADPGEDIRAIDAPFGRVKYRGKTHDARTHNKGLTIRLDHDGEGAVPGAEERAAARLIKRLRRNELVRAVVALLAVNDMSNKTWNSASDPDADLLNLVDASGDAIGFDPNKLIMGRKAWIKRILALRASDKEGAKNAAMSPAELANWLDIDEVITLKARRAVSKDEKQSILGNKVVAFQSEPGAGVDDPSNIKRFVSRTDADTDVRVFRDVQMKFTDISVEHYSNIIVTSTLGVKGYNIA